MREMWVCVCVREREEMKGKRNRDRRKMKCVNARMQMKLQGIKYLPLNFKLNDLMLQKIHTVCGQRTNKHELLRNEESLKVTDLRQV